eukprot:CAMPEP_0181403670 /NCGR_PEP_ID=MMETSP1110-20121109/3836_1 /TAXON_ID=174948 /ORGANISM="Symbiodinium sp., Strain CCMP421" /LENGTH=87 /DNA_ID=CAMNT_0023525979 /DNA_START=420 /DNA_END=679 /DNA_ORIENTATION=+
MLPRPVASDSGELGIAPAKEVLRAQNFHAGMEEAKACIFQAVVVEIARGLVQVVNMQPQGYLIYLIIPGLLHRHIRRLGQALLCWLG